ncbi:hypothetical protein [Tenuifilum thalassicum]|uniref:Uncharacterized protein n=1 Tax=Tenuifilum thalassicum TaxID=2590900 RepID=A0A7D4CGV0_9BACT|nr:hypothetical protein [Tenuifilum thalassicum]QKG80126.1 hypothetical protein FHG85_07585 [Tenuifilum thalassicum]
MERAKKIGQIIAVIKQLRKETDELFTPDNIINQSDILIEEFFLQKLNPLIARIREQVRRLPVDEYLPIEIDSWIRLINLKLQAIESGNLQEKYAEVLYIKKRFYPEVVNALKELQLEVLEAEFEARVDSDSALKPTPAANTIVISHESLSLLISMLYNFNIIGGNVSVEEICRCFSMMTGYDANQLMNQLKFDESSGRLLSTVNANDMDVLIRLLKSIISRIENLKLYTD